VLQVSDLEVGYGDVVAVKGAGFSVGEGEIVSLVGSNGAGKTTILKAVSGLLRPRRGEIRFDGDRLDRLPSDEIVARGVVHVPEGRGVFPRMTIEENLYLGAFHPAARKKRMSSLERVYEYFPRLRERKKQLAGTLSGGEQQMLAFGRGLMALPRLLMLDEPSLGLSPLIVQQLFQVILQIASEGTTILLVEQNVNVALAISQRGYVIENGAITLSGTGKELLGNEKVKKAYLGL
jgi:ABC-type branched-chain amino acid transport systems, ATPase component